MVWGLLVFWYIYDVIFLNLPKIFHWMLLDWDSFSAHIISFPLIHWTLHILISKAALTIQTALVFTLGLFLGILCVSHQSTLF